MTHAQRFLIPVLVLLTAGGCASYGPSDESIGLDRDRIIEKLGPPTHERITESGAVLEYARGPYGRHTYFLILNSASRVDRWEQVLHERNFNKILPGATKDQVRSLIGQSFEILPLARGRGEVWSYRYETPLCVWFQIEFDQQGLVRSAGDGIPPECLNRRWLMVF